MPDRKLSALPIKSVVDAGDYVAIYDPSEVLPADRNKVVPATAFLDRSQHEGAVPAEDVSGFAPVGAVEGEIALFGPSGGALLKRMTGSGFVKVASGVASVRTPAETKSDLSLTKGDVGLGNVDNTSDASKPISSATSTALAGKSNTGHTHTASNVTDFNTAVRTNPLDQMATPTAAVAMGSQRITGVADPTGAQDGATKAYVDADIELAILNALATTGTTRDFKIVGTGRWAGYIVLGHFRTTSTVGWTLASNAVHTVASGKTLLILELRLTAGVPADNANRKMRVYNRTDATNVIGENDGIWLYGQSFSYIEAYGGNGFATVAAGKQIALDVWVSNALSRGLGGLVICKEI